MANVIVKVLTKADNFNIMSVEQARLSMQLQQGDPTGSDAYLGNLIEVNSDVISTLCNRVFAREQVRETWRCLNDPCDCEDAKTSRRLFLTHWPVKEEDVEGVWAPRGGYGLDPYPLASNGWELDEDAGILQIYASTAEPIMVQYWGGYELPDEAPAALRWALMLLVSAGRATAASEASSLAAAGVRSIAHKESRITFQQGTTTMTSGGTDKATGMTPAMSAAMSLLYRYRRFWV